MATNDNSKIKAGPETEAPAAGAEAPQAEPTPEDRIAALEAETAELKDRLLRTLAEMENVRRRTEREVKDAGTYAITGFARDALGVADNLRRALEAAGEEARAAADGVLKTVLDGVELTEREFLKVLEKHGVRRIDPKGERFDPHLHQAMFEVPDATSPSGIVAQVIQPGYVIGDRVLRPALVGVTKGGAKQAKPDKAAGVAGRGG